MKVGRSQIALKAERGIRRRDRKVAGKRIGERNQPQRRREVCREAEVRFAEIQPFAWRQRRVVVVKAIRAAHDGRRRVIDRPCGAEARRPVVAIGLIARARQTCCADGHEHAGLRIVESGAILGIDGRRGDVVPQPRGQGQVRPHTIAVLDERGVRLRPQPLRIVEPARAS